MVDAPNPESGKNGKPPKGHWEAKPKPHWVEVWTLAILGIVGLFQICIYWRQANIMDAQNEITKNANRPWLGLSGDVKIVSPLTFDESGAGLKIHLPVKNSGGSPARGTFVIASMIIGPLFHIGPLPPGEAIQAQFNLNCQFTPIRSNGLGVLILPNDPMPANEPTALYVFTKDFRPPGGQDAHAWVGTCIGYSDQFDHPHGTITILRYDPKPGVHLFPPTGIVDGSLTVVGAGSSAY